MEDWINGKKILPDDGDKVVIAVRNKNKEDGIWLFDISIYYKDSGFEERFSTWEDGLYWKPLIDPE